MRYLTLACNYSGSCLYDNFSGEIDLATLNLEANLLSRILAWNEQYKSIIPLSMQERLNKIHIIDQLDQEGIAITNELTQIIDDVKIQYYSEGKLQYLVY